VGAEACHKQEHAPLQPLPVVQRRPRRLPSLPLRRRAGRRGRGRARPDAEVLSISGCGLGRSFLGGLTALFLPF
jgi:hypothetical protein